MCKDVIYAVDKADKEFHDSYSDFFQRMTPMKL